MNPLRANFSELYRRHLCRHSEFGINVAHIVSVVGTYLALFGLIYGLVHSEWVVVALTIPYLAVLLLNIPLGVFVVNAAFMGLIMAAAFALPEISWWWYLPALFVFHRIQIWSHRFYTRELDMTKFSTKYRKGFALFVLLAVYELPILVNYLFFGRSDWYFGSHQAVEHPGDSQKATQHADDRDPAAV
jgi:hypothetical protein